MAKEDAEFEKIYIQITGTLIKQIGYVEQKNTLERQELIQILVTFFIFFKRNYCHSSVYNTETLSTEFIGIP